MWQDEILDEIHYFREEHVKSFNYNLDAMFEDWHKKQAEGGREIVNLQQVKQKTDEVNTGKRN